MSGDLLQEFGLYRHWLTEVFCGVAGHAGDSRRSPHGILQTPKLIDQAQLLGLLAVKDPALSDAVHG